MDAHSSPHHEVPSSNLLPKSHPGLTLHSSVELSVGIICSCLPFMPACFRKSGYVPLFGPVRSLLSGWGLLRPSASADVSRRAPPSSPRALTQEHSREMGQIPAGHRHGDGLERSSKTIHTASQSSGSDSL